MATALAAQLAQLASTKPQQDKYIKGKASLLFDYQKAADVANEQCLNIARSGESWLGNGWLLCRSRGESFALSYGPIWRRLGPKTHC